MKVYVNADFFVSGSSNSVSNREVERAVPRVGLEAKSLDLFELGSYHKSVSEDVELNRSNVVSYVRLRELPYLEEAG